MQHKALVAFATVLVMILAALPLEAADPAPEGKDFSTGFYWESNNLNKDKVLEIYGDETVDDLASSLLNSMFVTDYSYWTASLIECDLKDKDALYYATFPYEGDDGYYEIEYRAFFEMSGHIKMSVTPAERSIDKPFFRLGDNVIASGALESEIRNAEIRKGTVITIECQIDYMRSFDVDATYIKNNNGKYIVNSAGTDRSYYLSFENAKVTMKIDDRVFEFKVGLHDSSSHEYIKSYYSVDDPSEEGMKKVKSGDALKMSKAYHNTWNDWYGTITYNGMNGKIESYADTCYNEDYNIKVTDDSFITADKLKSASFLYESWFYGKGGDVEKTESFLKSNGHFEKGYECGKYYYGVLYNDLMDEDKDFSKYVSDKTKSSSNNTMLYAVSAIAVILLIVSIALAVMYKKKTA